MHESDKDPILEELKKQTEILERIYDAVMSNFVQTTRLYDVFAASATGADESQIVALLGNHEQGLIDTAPPVIKDFGNALEDE